MLIGRIQKKSYIYLYFDEPNWYNRLYMPKEKPKNDPIPVQEQSPVDGWTDPLVPPAKEKKETGPASTLGPTTTPEPKAPSPKHEGLTLNEIIADINKIAAEYEDIKRNQSDKRAIQYLAEIGLTPKFYGIFRKAHLEYLDTQPAQIALTKEAVIARAAAVTQGEGGDIGEIELLANLIAELRTKQKSGDKLTLFDHPEVNHLSDFYRLYSFIVDQLREILDSQASIDNPTYDDAIPQEILDGFALLTELALENETQILVSQDELVYANPIILDEQEEHDFKDQLAENTDLNKPSSVHIGNASVFCISSQEAINGGKAGQDAIGVGQYVDNDGKIITKIVATDGVGSSTIGEIAARELVKVELSLASLLGSVKDSYQNITLLELILVEALRNIHSSLPGIIDQANLAPMIKKAILGAIKDTRGSASMLMSIDVHSSGRVRGHFVGDGGVILIRKNEDPIFQKTGSHKTRISSEAGIEHTAGITFIKDLFGEEIILSPGDVIVIHSDGIQRGDKETENVHKAQAEIVAVVQRFQKGELTAQERDSRIAEILSDTGYYGGGDDDRNLGLYAQPEN